MTDQSSLTPLIRDIRSIVGCQNLNCDGKVNDQNYANSNYNEQYIALNQGIYNLGQQQLGTGQEYNQLVINNIKKDPVGATLAGAGMIGLGVVTAGGAPALGWMAVGGTLGGTANASVQYLFNGSVNPVDVSIGVATGALTFGTGLLPGLLINTGGALASSTVKGENPNVGMAGAAVGTVVGYGLGSATEGTLNNIFNSWYRPQWKNLGLGISVAVPKSPVPSVFGAGFGAVGQEVTGSTTSIIINKSPSRGGK